jgi:hypothetical protein
MIVDEIDEGPYRIYAAALRQPQGGGYVSAVVIRRRLGEQGSYQDAWRDEALAGGLCWVHPEDALRHALARGRQVVREQGALLAC